MQRMLFFYCTPSETAIVYKCVQHDWLIVTFFEPHAYVDGLDRVLGVESWIEESLLGHVHDVSSVVLLSVLGLQVTYVARVDLIQSYSWHFVALNNSSRLLVVLE